MFCGLRRKTWIAAAIAAGLIGAAGGAWAHMHRPFGPERMFGRLDKVRAELKLNERQEALWKNAETRTRESFERMRANGRELREKMRAGLEQPGADLKQLAQLGDQLRQQAEASRRQTREAWFELYDSLDAGQKEQVRQFLKQRMDRFNRRRGRS